MKAFVKRMVEEHAELVSRIDKLHNYLYSERSDIDDKVEFANKCIQLSAMKKYEEALSARLENQGVKIYGCGSYYELVTDSSSEADTNFESKSDNKSDGK